MLLITTCFSTVTPESAEDGEAAESGFLSQDEPTTFRDLVSLLKHGTPSAWPASGGVNEWVSQDQGETWEYFELGERTEHTFHFSRSNPARKVKYWALAFKAAGLTRG
jgi:hypothetical protein